MDLDKPEAKSPIVQEEEKEATETLKMDSSSLFNQMADVMIVPPSSLDGGPSGGEDEPNPYLDPPKAITPAADLSDNPFSDNPFLQINESSTSTDTAPTTSA